MSPHEEARIAELRGLSDQQAWEKAKPEILAKFERFVSEIRGLKGRRSFTARSGTATDEDVVRFGIRIEQTGRTKVHTNECHERRHGKKAKKGNKQCECPARKAHKSLMNELCQLKKAMEEVGVVGPYNARTLEGNPVDGPLSKRFLAMVGLEQAKAGVEQQQAEPLFTAEVEKMLEYLRWKVAEAETAYNEAREKGEDTGQLELLVYRGQRNVVFFSFIHQHWDRASDTAAARWSKLGHDILRITAAKTVRAPSHRVRAVRIDSRTQRGQQLMVGMLGLKEWAQAHAEHVPNTDLMFMKVTEKRSGGVTVLECGGEAVTTPEMVQQLQRAVRGAGIPEADLYTCKSMRMGGAITAYREGESWEFMAEHGFWKTQAMLEHYSQAHDSANKEANRQARE